MKEAVKALLSAHRADHHRDGSRQSYYGADAKAKLGIGVTKFERTVSELGLTIKPKKRWVRDCSEKCVKEQVIKNELCR